MHRISFSTFSVVLLIVPAVAGLSRGEPAKLLVTNGTFEEGQDEPLEWDRKAGGAWESGTAHRGQRFARVEAADERGWESSLVPLSPDVDYRLEGWIRAADGTALLGVDLLDAGGRLVRSVEAPHAEGAAEWRYVAVEFKADASQAKIWLAGEGRADFDDLALVPVVCAALT